MLIEDEPLPLTEDVALVLKLLVYLDLVCDAVGEDALTRMRRDKALDTYVEVHQWLQKQGVLPLWDKRTEKYRAIPKPS